MDIVSSGFPSEYIGRPVEKIFAERRECGVGVEKKGPSNFAQGERV